MEEIRSEHAGDAGIPRLEPIAGAVNLYRVTLTDSQMIEALEYFLNFLVFEDEPQWVQVCGFEVNPVTDKWSVVGEKV